jgi:hypothetical protein
MVRPLEPDRIENAETETAHGDGLAVVVLDYAARPSKIAFLIRIPAPSRVACRYSPFRRIRRVSAFEDDMDEKVSLIAVRNQYRSASGELLDEYGRHFLFLLCGGDASGKLQFQYHPRA